MSIPGVLVGCILVDTVVVGILVDTVVVGILVDTVVVGILVDTVVVGILVDTVVAGILVDPENAETVSSTIIRNIFHRAIFCTNKLQTIVDCSLLHLYTLI